MIATDKQVHWITKIGPQVTLPEGTVKSIVDKVLAGQAVERSEASAALDFLFKAPKNAPKAVEAITPGMFRKDGTIYRVQANREKTGVYAKELHAGREGGFYFTYAGSLASVGLTNDHRMTKEEAQAFGVETGTCCVCAAVLTDPKSIAAGIGPVCAGRV